MSTLMGATIRSKEWEGRTVGGRFPLRQWLGASEHSSVFTTDRAGQKAAIKLVRADSDSEAERQLASWGNAAQLSHPNLIRLFDSGRTQIDGQTYLYAVMEFADEDLSQILPQRPLAPAEVSQLLPPLLGALAYLHRKGFLHGRIKPSNVLATGDQLKLSVDQILPVSPSDARRMRRDVYDAPETAAGILTPASDLWSVGVTLYTALTQNLPEEGPKEGATQLAPIAEPFYGIVRDCLQLDPKRRSSIADILTRLDPEASQVEPKPQPEKPQWRGNRAFVTMGILLTALVIAFIVFLSARNSQSSKPAQTAAEQASSSAAPASVPAVVSSSPETPPKHDSAGSVLHQALPEISQSARNTITGKIRIVARADVDASGKVTHAKLTTSGPSGYFARLSLQAAERWQFSPPIVNSHPVASVWSITYRIGRKQTQAGAERLRR